MLLDTVPMIATTQLHCTARHCSCQEAHITLNTALQLTDMLVEQMHDLQYEWFDHISYVHVGNGCKVAVTPCQGAYFT